MKSPNLAGLALAAVNLAACAGPGALAGVGAPTALLQHIERCERHYMGGTGLGAALTFRIDCPAQPAQGASDKPVGHQP